MRLRKVLLIGFFGLNAVVISAFVAAPYIASSVIANYLPKTIAPGVVATSAAVMDIIPATVAVYVPRQRVVDEIAARKNRQVPVWCIPTGVTVLGRLRDVDHQADFSWGVSTVATGPLRADVSVSAAWVNARIKEASRSHEGASLSWVYALGSGTTATLIGEPDIAADHIRWRYRVQAKGTVAATLKGDRCECEVDRLEGEVEIDAFRGHETWWLQGQFRVQTCESRIVHSDSAMLTLAAKNLGAVIQLLINERLRAENLENIRIPNEFPAECHVNVRLTDDPLPVLPPADDAASSPTAASAAQPHVL